MTDDARTLWIVVPAYNESASIALLIAALNTQASSDLPGGLRLRALVVDDGSEDATYETACRAGRELGDLPRFSVSVLRLSRNFGQQAAIQAGLEHAFAASSPADWFLVMDGDLQHPPALIPKIVQQLGLGIDHVQMVRQDPPGLPWFKRASSSLFYVGFRSVSGLRMPAGSSDFRGMSRRFLEAYLQLRERGRFNRGLFCWIGFDTAFLTYESPLRAHGTSKYGLRTMLRFAWTGLIQFSSKPLIAICSAIVLMSFLTCLAYLVFEVVQYCKGRHFVVGWPSLMFMITFWSGAIALSQLLLAIYLARIFDEIKNRPIYVVREQWNPPKS